MTSNTTNAPFAGVDLAVVCAAVAGKLRSAGIEVGLGQTARATDALSVGRPQTMAELYWLLRTSMVSDIDDMAVFDAVFAAVFDDVGLPITPSARKVAEAATRMEGTILRHDGPRDGLAEARGRVQSQAPPEIDADEDATDESSDGDDERELLVPLPGLDPGLADRSFDQMSPAELAEVSAWLAATVSVGPKRPTRRFQRANRGRLDMRRTVAQGRRTAGEPIAQARRERRTEPRPVVMLADVSASMESYARVYLQLMAVLVRDRRAEAFAFATEVHRVTPVLRRGDPAAMAAGLTNGVGDRFGGTRIGHAIGEVLSSSVWSTTLRGASVVIASDGADSGPPDELGRRVARLGRLAHRLIWVNPRAAADGYEPLVAGMAAALGHVDGFISGHSPRSLLAVVAELDGGHAAR